MHRRGVGISTEGLERSQRISHVNSPFAILAPTTRTFALCCTQVIGQGCRRVRRGERGGAAAPGTLSPHLCLSISIASPC